MDFITRIFRTKPTINTVDEFWTWFQRKERRFLKIVREQVRIEECFFDLLSPVLNQLNSEAFFLLNDEDEGIIELIFTADDIINNASFIEGLVDSAPALEQWKFIAFQPALDIEKSALEIAGFHFNKDTISFYQTSTRKSSENVYTIVYSDYDKNNENIIQRGVYSFLQAYVGELVFNTKIARIKVVGSADIAHQPFPIECLKDAIHWKGTEI